MSTGDTRSRERKTVSTGDTKGERKVGETLKILFVHIWYIMYREKTKTIQAGRNRMERMV